MFRESGVLLGHEGLDLVGDRHEFLGRLELLFPPQDVLRVALLTSARSLIESCSNRSSLFCSLALTCEHVEHLEDEIEILVARELGLGDVLEPSLQVPVQQLQQLV